MPGLRDALKARARRIGGAWAGRLLEADLSIDADFDQLFVYERWGAEEECVDTYFDFGDEEEEEEEEGSDGDDEEASASLQLQLLLGESPGGAVGGGGGGGGSLEELLGPMALLCLLRSLRAIPEGRASWLTLEQARTLPATLLPLHVER